MTVNIAPAAPLHLPEPGDPDGVRATISQRVFLSLRQAIVQLNLQPGDLLSEAEVAKQLGVSRQPVREAFIKLSEVGLVDIRPQRGTFVNLISRRAVENARFIREAIEVAIVRRAAEVASAEAVAGLSAIIDAQREASAADDRMTFMIHDEAFHQAIADSADCDHAWGVLENLKTQMDRVRFLLLPIATPTGVLIAQHQAILDAIAAHDADSAESAMREHLAEILKTLPQLSRQFPALFAD